MQRGNGCGAIVFLGLLLVAIAVAVENPGAAGIVVGGLVGLYVIVLLLRSVRQDKRSESRPPHDVESREFNLANFRCYVRGTDRQNPDGQDRQKLVRKCSVGDRLELEREPSNLHDANAIKVMDRAGRQLGHIPADTTEWLADVIDKGEVYEVTVEEVTKTDRWGWGLRIRLRVPE